MLILKIVSVLPALADFEIIPRFEAVPTAISGTLSPLTIAIDGKVLIHEPEASAIGIELNGDPLVVDSEKSNKPFFVNASADHLVLKLQSLENTFREVRLPLLPRIKNIESIGMTLSFEIEGADRVEIDGEGVELKQTTAVWPVPVASEAFNKIHVVEIKDQHHRRLYNLRLDRIEFQTWMKKIELRITGIVNLGIAASLKSKWTFAGFAGFGFHGVDLWSIRTEAGRQIIPREVKYAPWLEGGIYVAYLQYVTYMPEKVAAKTMESGIYISSELLSSGMLGAGVGAQFTVFRAGYTAILKTDSSMPGLENWSSFLKISWHL